MVRNHLFHYLSPTSSNPRMHIVFFVQNTKLHKTLHSLGKTFNNILKFITINHSTNLFKHRSTNAICLKFVKYFSTRSYYRKCFLSSKRAVFERRQSERIFTKCYFNEILCTNRVRDSLFGRHQPHFRNFSLDIENSWTKRYFPSATNVFFLALIFSRTY